MNSLVIWPAPTSLIWLSGIDFPILSELKFNSLSSLWRTRNYLSNFRVACVTDRMNNIFLIVFLYHAVTIIYFHNYILFVIPSPVTYSPSLKLRLGAILDLSIALNSCTPRTNDLLMSCCTSSRLRFNTTSGSDAGGGSLKASKPGKKFNILSATSLAWSPLESKVDLKTYEQQNTVVRAYTTF